MFRLASSVVLRGERGAADRYRCVWVALTVFRPHWLCPAHGFVCSSRLNCSGSRLLYLERALCCVQFQFSGIPQKRGLGCTCILGLSRPSSSGSQELDGHSLPGCSVPSPLCGPSLSFPQHQSGVCALCLAVILPMSTIQNLRKSLVRNWRPVGSVVGDVISGAEFAPFPSPLPPASSGDQSFVLRTAGSVFGPVNFLSLSLSHSLSCYLTKAPSDCSQGLRPGPYPKQCRPLLSAPSPLAGGGYGRLGYFFAGSCF